MDIVAAIRQSWSEDTTYCPEEWTEDNPAYGQCAVSSLVYQDYTGADIIHGDVTYDEEGVPITVYHFWNFIDDAHLDISKDQFPDTILEVDEFGFISRGEILTNHWFEERYETLKKKVDSLLQKRV